MKSIAFGQYYPAKSFLHRLDPRIKIIITVLYIISTFLCKNTLSFAALLLSALILVILGRIPLRIIFGGLRPIIFILCFTVLLNIFLTSGEGDPLAQFWILKIYKFYHFS